MRSLCLLLCSSCLLSLAASAQSPHPKVKLRAFTTVESAKDAAGNAVRPEATTSSLTTFTYTTTSSRDGNTYTGVMVGQDPFSSGFTPTNITTPIVPLIITTNAVAIKLNKKGILAMVKGSTTFDPTSPDNACLSAPNNVPETLFQQSPIFQNNDFVFGATDVGSTQYLDAFQRANFWQFVQGTDYHTLVNPVMLPPITLNISIAKALAIPPSLFGSCGSLGIIEKKTFDSIVANTLLPQLAAEGVDTSQFPIFLMYNVVLSLAPPNNLNQCCVLGYHSSSGSPAQTFSPIDFDTTGLFGPGIFDTSIAAHEVGEWMDDPFGSNPTPAWGHTGQVSGCQSNVEVGDPLTGTNVPNVVGSNGFTYHLQELAFFSWFYGQPSIAANGWFSDNNTFTTDAGPVCQ
ncbi:MAG TPA: hypothetical protein VFO46_19010 [Candidatus Sulfotelmatobacter sp.]|nr:hypothetical protein [Candidatus Sulfotelmatobacter sp.]